MVNVRQPTLKAMNKTYLSHKNHSQTLPTDKKSPQNQDKKNMSQDPPETFLVRGPRMGPL